MIQRQPHSRLHRFQVLNTDNRDVLYNVFAGRYDARGVDVRGNAEPLRGVANYLPLKNLDLSYGSLSTEVSAIFSGNDLVRQQFVLSGSNRISIGSSQFNVNTNNTAIVPAEVDFRGHFFGDFSQLFVRIPAITLRSKLTSLIGRPVSRNIEFATGVADQTPEQMQLWRLLDFFVSELDRDDVGIMDGALVEFEQVLIVSFLKANAHNFSHLLSGEALSAAPWQVRAVEEYIEANWKRPITIEELAHETGVGVRNMFITFKKVRGYTPIAFLQRIRLEHARNMLRAPTEATSVLAVSLMCGFHNAGHFARYYRLAFNELPSATLNEAKGNRRMSAATSGRSGVGGESDMMRTSPKRRC